MRPDWSSSAQRWRRARLRNTFEASEPGPHARLYYEQLIDLMCLQLLRAHSAFPGIAAHGRAGLADWQVQRVTRQMVDRLGEPVSRR